MMKAITETQFDALRPTNESLIISERDVDWGSESFLNDAGEEIAFATFGPGGAKYTRNDPPRPKAVFDEDGNIVADGWC